MIHQTLFRAESHGHAYGFDLALFGAVSVEESKWNTKGRNIILNIVKANSEDAYWPRLTKEKVKNTHIQADWAKWVDEDEEDEAKPLGEDWNEDNMNNFGGGGAGGQFGGPGGDSDDEEEEEEEHVHGENCDHDHGVGQGEKNADLGDLDAEEEPAK
jgi:hypothetical protein